MDILERHGLSIRTGYQPGVIGRVTELHGRYYGTYWDLGVPFESMVATELAEFLSRFDERRDGFWTVRDEQDLIVGSIAIDGAEPDAADTRLRWFILDDDQRGRGLGHVLMEQAVGFCKQSGCQRVYLWTFAVLAPARHLYQKFGFRQFYERENDQWGRLMREQQFELLF